MRLRAAHNKIPNAPHKRHARFIEYDELLKGHIEGRRKSSIISGNSAYLKRTCCFQIVFLVSHSFHPSLPLSAPLSSQDMWRSCSSLKINTWCFFFFENESWASVGEPFLGSERMNCANVVEIANEKANRRRKVGWRGKRIAAPSFTCMRYYKHICDFRAN